jgi:hypothetical protein
VVVVAGFLALCPQCLCALLHFDFVGTGVAAAVAEANATVAEKSASKTTAMIFFIVSPPFIMLVSQLQKLDGAKDGNVP